MSGRRSHWDHVYTAKAETALSWFQARADVSLELIAAASPRTASVIDIGGGVSHLPADLLARGYADLAVLDISAAALERNRQRLGADAGKIEWIVADIAAWQPPRTWDVWHDRAVFHFLTETADQDAYLRALDAATVTGGAAIISAFALDGPEKCSGLPVQRYSAATLAARLGDRFGLTGERSERHRTPAGNIQHFVYATFVKR